MPALQLKQPPVTGEVIERLHRLDWDIPHGGLTLAQASSGGTRYVRSVRLALLLTLSALTAHAHHDPLSRSQWRVLPDAGVVGATLIFRVADLAPAVLGHQRLPALDREAQLEGLDKTLRALAPGFIEVRNDGSACSGRLLRIQHQKGVELGFTFDCGRSLGRLEVSFPLLGKLAADHRNMATLDVGGAVESATFTRDQQSWAREFAGARARGDEHAGGAPRPGSAEGGATVPPAPTAAVGGPPLATVAWLGLTHVLAGLDHVLFVLGLVLAARRLRDLVAHTLVFTLAHSITLALAATGRVEVSPALAEPLIALSLVAIAWQAVDQAEHAGSTAAIVAVFGLIHGLGFAGGLLELSLEPAALLAPLLAFNCGVEAAQLLVAGLAWGVVAVHRERQWYRARLLIPSSVAIALAGLIYAVERVTHA